MMADVRVLDDEPVKPLESLEGVGRMGLDLAKYMAEHVYMYSSCILLPTRVASFALRGR